MGKQEAGFKKLDDDPCSALAKASLKCMQLIHVATLTFPLYYPAKVCGHKQSR